MNRERLRIAIQKKGRLNRDSLDLLLRCGLNVQISQNALLSHVENLPIDLLFVRDDDIPGMVMDGICDFGIVGENVLLEKEIYRKRNGYNSTFKVIKKFEFGRCRLSIAFPKEFPYSGSISLKGLRFATSYPNLLQEFFYANDIKADILTVSGSVEIAPEIDMADTVCDLVSTGKTLEENNLKEVKTIINSQAVLISSTKARPIELKNCIQFLCSKIEGEVI